MADQPEDNTEVDENAIDGDADTGDDTNWEKLEGMMRRVFGEEAQKWSKQQAPSASKTSQPKEAEEKPEPGRKTGFLTRSFFS